MTDPRAAWARLFPAKEFDQDWRESMVWRDGQWRVRTAAEPYVQRVLGWQGRAMMRREAAMEKWAQAQMDAFMKAAAARALMKMKKKD